MSNFKLHHPQDHHTPHFCEFTDRIDQSASSLSKSQGFVRSKILEDDEESEEDYKDTFPYQSSSKLANFFYMPSKH
jgi:hypothetical protein